jgi:hypothetical protein
MVKVAFSSCLWGIPIFFDKHLLFVPQAVHIHTEDVGGGGGENPKRPLTCWGGGKSGGKKRGAVNNKIEGKRLE